MPVNQGFFEIINHFAYKIIANAPNAFKRAESRFDIFNLIFTILPRSA